MVKVTAKLAFRCISMHYNFDVYQETIHVDQEIFTSKIFDFYIPISVNSCKRLCVSIYFSNTLHFAV